MSRRNLAIVKIVILSLLGIMVFGLFMFLMDERHDLSDLTFNKSEAKLMKSETYNLNEVNKIVTNLRDADIEIKHTNENIIKVDLYDKDKDKMDVSLSNGELSIEFTGSNFCFGFCFFGGRRVIVYLPESFDKDIEIVTASGEVNMPKVLSRVEIKTVSGDVFVESADNLTIKTTSGDVKVGSSKKTYISTVSGEIEIRDTEEFEGKTTSGDLDIDILNTSIDFSTVSGDIDIASANIIKDSKIGTVSGDVEINSLNRIYVNTKTTSGDVEIYGTDRMSKITLDIKTTSGDIEIN